MGDEFDRLLEQIFLGREIAQHRDYSESTAIRIDEEVKKLVSKAYDRTKKILTENTETLHRLAHSLLEREVLDGVEIDAIIRGEELPPLRHNEDAPVAEKEGAGEDEAVVNDEPEDPAPDA